MFKRTSSANVYEIRNTTFDRCYVGSTTNVFGRFSQHLWHLRRGTHNNERMTNDWKRDPDVSHWTFRVLEMDATDDTKLGREAHWISTLNPYYNIKSVSPAPSKMATIEHALDLRKRGATVRQIAQLTRRSVGWVSYTLRRYETV